MYIYRLNTAGFLTIRCTALFNKNSYGLVQQGKTIQALSQKYRPLSSSQDTRSNKLIYSAPLARRIRSVKIFSLGTSLCGLMTQPVLFQKVMEEGFTVATVVSGIIFQIFTFVTPILLHYITKKYVREMYFNPDNDEYTAVTYSFWVQDKVLTFMADDVVVPDLPGMFTSIIVKGTPLFIDANYFNNINHYKRLMGFDKPIDFKLGDQPPKT